MSRLTAAQVIALGEYLEPDFDPSSLTVAQLLGVFGYHNVNYPSQYTKPRLVQLFNDEIKANASKLRRQRIKKESSQASDDGITDGLTGRPINEGRKPVTRRSSKRLSRAPPEQTEEPEPAPTKRRRSSAQPSLGGPSRQKSKSTKPVEPVVVEESEPEEEVVPRKVGRPKKSTTDAGSETRRVSQAFPEDSGWEDNNVFQSGADSSSPARPPPRRTRHTSASSRPVPKSRKSLSAPPQYASESPERGPGPAQLPRSKPPSTAKPRSSVKPPSSAFEPQLPPDIKRGTRSGSRSRRGSAAPESKQERLFIIPSQVTEEQESDLEEEQQMEALREDIASPKVEAEPQLPVTEPGMAEGTREDSEELEGDVASDADEYTDEQVAAVSKRISEGGQVVRHQPDSDSRGYSFFTRLILLLLVLSSSGVLYEYKRESSEIGFCNANTTTNAVLEDRRARAAAVELCQRENRTALYVSNARSAASPVPTGTASASGQVSQPATDNALEICPPLALFPLPHPETCTPCPRHATCTPSSVACESGYIPRSHPFLYYVPVPDASPPGQLSETTFTRPRSLLSADVDVPELAYSAVSALFDGLPGLGPVAFPPRCVVDVRRRRYLNAMAKNIEGHLSGERGRRLCLGENAGLPETTQLEQAKKWGMELEVVKEVSKRQVSSSQLPTFPESFSEAVTQLVDWGVVFVAEGEDGTRYIASKNLSMDTLCVLRVKCREAWAEWKASVIGSAILVLCALVIKRRRAQNAAEKERAAGLVQITLDLLRNQELAHHTDPVTAPYPYLSSLQLRDLVLQDEHSVSTRTHLWQRVERVVEGNANVRTNLEEVEGGDEQRVWHWVGSAGKLGTPARAAK
ncbi:hypothetical protein DAEQUDRAFT_727125 [Daedalea quercina L-15889]|uniref:Man1/Src1 C-terminal domain-containing protein n=1 Tax=Daedalea quercina L-15889 TaxID=1314783 RepID=A0A165Q3E1_9APHY|nr:hypothetical protein DAEQUDRAFT_727125 [Daedalea quercina L-15889]